MSRLSNCLADQNIGRTGRTIVLARLSDLLPIGDQLTPLLLAFALPLVDSPLRQRQVSLPQLLLNKLPLSAVFIFLVGVASLLQHLHVGLRGELLIVPHHELELFQRLGRLDVFDCGDEISIC